MQDGDRGMEGAAEEVMQRRGHSAGCREGQLVDLGNGRIGIERKMQSDCFWSLLTSSVSLPSVSKIGRPVLAAHPGRDRAARRNSFFGVVLQPGEGVQVDFLGLT